MVSEATNVVCGADFTVWLSSVEGSSILYVSMKKEFLMRSKFIVASDLLVYRSSLSSWLSFSMLICRTAGLPQYGQLGHGTNNEVCFEDI